MNSTKKNSGSLTIFLGVFLLFVSQSSVFSSDNSSSLNSLLSREWTSANGEHKCSGTLRAINSDNCVIVFTDKVKTIQTVALAEEDKLFLSALEFADLSDCESVQEAVSRISGEFNYVEAVEEIGRQSTRVMTTSGREFCCTDLVQLNPWRARFKKGGRGYTIELCDFDRESKSLLMYNRSWEREYKQEQEQLSTRGNLAWRNYRLALKHNKADVTFNFPKGNAVATSGSWGVAWIPSSIVADEIQEGRFSAALTDYYFGGWEHYDARSIRNAIAVKERSLRRAKRKETFARKRSLSRRSYSYSYLLAKSSYSGRVQVRGYHRRDGTYVRPHTRSYPSR